jgi:hypothetical protein
MSRGQVVDLFFDRPQKFYDLLESSKLVIRESLYVTKGKMYFLNDIMQMMLAVN